MPIANRNFEDIHFFEIRDIRSYEKEWHATNGTTDADRQIKGCTIFDFVDR